VRCLPLRLLFIQLLLKDSVALHRARFATCRLLRIDHNDSLYARCRLRCKHVVRQSPLMTGAAVFLWQGAHGNNVNNFLFVVGGFVGELILFKTLRMHLRIGG